MTKAAATIREEEIRPDDIFTEFMNLSIADAQNFFDKSKFVKVSCPGCGTAGVTESFEKWSFAYNSCAVCGTVYASPRPTRAEILRYYAESRSQTYWSDTVLRITGEKRKQSIVMPALERVETVMKDLGRDPARVLDIGAASGAFLAEWKKRHPAAQIFGIEPGADAAAKCRAAGVTVFESFVEDEAEKGRVQGDLVTCFEVLEHAQDPTGFAKAVYGVTAPGGVAVLSCLGADGFDIQVLWQDSRSITPPYHLNFLSKKGMEILFAQAGFSRVDIFTPGRLDVEIVQRSRERGLTPSLSRFEKLLLSRGPETLAAFQEFLADNALSSHVWIVAHR